MTLFRSFHRMSLMVICLVLLADPGQAQSRNTISGMGKVWYMGAPEISQSVSGMGKIAKE